MVADPNRKPDEFFSDYSKRDHEIVDYEFYKIAEEPQVAFRGPPLSEADYVSGNFFTTLGAAQTFGVYVEDPFPSLLSQRIGIPALNLAMGGAAPSFYTERPDLLGLANRGRFVILQVMTARTSPNSRLHRVGPLLLRDVTTGKVDTSEIHWSVIMNDERDQLGRYLEESRASWQEDYRNIISQISVPVILFFFSHKPVDEVTDLDADTVLDLYGTFPQFVSTDDVSTVAKHCAGYAECRSKRNYGHLLRSRFTGEPVVIDYSQMHPSAAGMVHTHNYDYPTAEMHEDAVEPLVCEIQRLGLDERIK